MSELMIHELFSPLGMIAARADDDVWLSYFASGKLEPRVRRQVSVHGDVAVIPLQGAIVRGMPQAGTDPDEFRRAVNAASLNSRIKQILIMVDSPGGTVAGVELAAQAVYNARSVKPVISLTSDLNCSAALWISMQASKVFSTRDGFTGSHGVFLQHASYAKYLDKIGIELTFVHAGKYKVEGSMFRPLGDDAKAYIQDRVDGVFAEFTEALARGRDKSQEHVLEHFGQGRALKAKQALAVGMIDGIIEADQILSRLQGGAGIMAANEDLTAELLQQISSQVGEECGNRRHLLYQKKLKVRERETSL